MQFLATQPLGFEEQVEPRKQFHCCGPGYALFLTCDEVVLAFTQPDAAYAPTEKHALPEAVGPPAAATVRLRLVGSNSGAVPVAEAPETCKIHYFLGNDAAQWRTGVARHGRVRYANVYPGIDWVFHGSERKLKHDFLVGPGANPGVIQLRFDGVQRLELDPAGDLILHAAAGTWRQPRPLIYQEVDGARREVSGGYVLQGTNVVGFALGPHDSSRPLVIDPVLVYSSYVGGVGQDQALGVAVDAAGNAYVTGINTLFASVPPTFLTQRSVFVAKVNPAGNLVYLTHLGGRVSNISELGLQAGNALAVDAAGNVYVTGNTTFSDFPIVNAAQSTHQGLQSSFVTKISADGGALIYSTFLGGRFMASGHAIAVDNAGQAHVTGSTNSSDFPTTVNAFQKTRLGPSAVFVTKVNASGNTFAYSTFLTGHGNDVGNGIAVDPEGSAYVTGSAHSADFPMKNPFQGAKKNPVGGAVFVTKLSPAGDALIYSTYLGGGAEDSGFAIAVDSSGNAYVTGNATSTDFPAIRPLLGTQPGSAAAFVTKLGRLGNEIFYSTYLGGAGTSSGAGIAVDPAGNVYVIGSTTSANFPLVNPFQTALRGTQAAFIAKFNPGGNALVYASFLGGSKDNIGHAIAVDAAGNVYVAGETTSTDFPLVAAFQPMPARDGSCGFVARLGDPGVLRFSQPAWDVLANSDTISVIVLRDAGTTAVNVEYRVHAGTATPGVDFLPTAGTLDFAAGQTSKSFSVTVLASTQPRGDRTVILDLSNASGGAGLGNPSTGVLTIHDAPGTFHFDASAATFQDNAGAVTVTVRRVGGVGAATVDFATSDGTAAAGTDYLPTHGTLAYGPTDASKDISVTILSNPQASDSRIFSIMLSNPSSGASLTDPRKILVVINHS